jgi:hypothetical protein
LRALTYITLGVTYRARSTGNDTQNQGSSQKITSPRKPQPVTAEFQLIASICRSLASSFTQWEVATQAQKTARTATSLGRLK